MGRGRPGRAPMQLMRAQSHVGITVRDLYFADPDGYPLELVENAYGRPGGHAAGIARYLETRPPAPQP